MSKNTNLSFLTDYITADITNGRIGINNASPTVAFDVTGANRFVGTTASDTAPLGSELAGVTGTGTNWALAGGATNLNVGGYIHTVGSVVPLTTSLAAVNGTYYQITYTITGRTAGSITIAYGGTSTAGITATGNTGPLASSTAVLTITPTTDFDGKVVLSIKTIGTSSASSTFANSSAGVNFEVRNNSSVTNMFFGTYAGSRITTATSNLFFGYQAGQTTTTGGSNTFIGNAAGQGNTIGAGNLFIGTNAGYLNLSGNNNVFIGTAAGYNNTAGFVNTFIGHTAGASNTTGFENSAFGYAALYSNTYGGRNTAIGINALYGNTNGSYNVALGQDAGKFIANKSTNATNVSNSTLLGWRASPLADNQTNQIVIGYDSTGLGSNTTVLGNSSTTTTAIYGNLSLGSTVDSGYKLDVTGTARVSGAATFSSSVTASTFTSNLTSGIFLSNSSGATNATQLKISNTSGDLRLGIESSTGDTIQTGTLAYAAVFGNQANAATQFTTNGTARLTITSAGNVGIGTSSPGSLLTVKGSGNYNGRIEIDNAVSFGGGILYISQNGVQSGFFGSRGSVLGSANRDLSLFATAGLGIYTYTNDGTVGPFVASGGTSWTSSSDERLKNIKDTIPDAVESILKLRAVIHTWKYDNEHKEHLGLIAQDIQKVFPQVVVENDDDIKTLGVNYTELIPVLVAAIQELSAEINILKNK